jgi:pyruvate/2-oxoglutarate dehydrogenase complex dihydrolipoamide dehydrogenase (E3) component
MDYINVPTTVFTPIEYGCVGYSEVDAKLKFGEENILVYHTEFKPLEWAYYKARPEGECYVKIIVNKLITEESLVSTFVHQMQEKSLKELVLQ